MVRDGAPYVLYHTALGGVRAPVDPGVGSAPEVSGGAPLEEAPLMEVVPMEFMMEYQPEEALSVLPWSM
jgi:hypothetical protein